ncbi:MAG: hypothetical protein MZV65_13240 [Chromatiales bacterium]|nr:hypothetical protein [Chromatiales bacterium]
MPPRVTGLPALADDSGLERATRCDGAPGIYSARYAGAGASDAREQRDKLLRQLSARRRSRSARALPAACWCACAAPTIPTPADRRRRAWEGRILDGAARHAAASATTRMFCCRARTDRGRTRTGRRTASAIAARRCASWRAG